MTSEAVHFAAHCSARRVRLLIGPVFLPDMQRQEEDQHHPKRISYPPAQKETVLRDRVQRISVRTIAMQRVLTLVMHVA